MDQIARPDEVQQLCKSGIAEDPHRDIMEKWWVSCGHRQKAKKGR